MPGVDLKRLIKAHKKVKADKSKYRLHAACLRKEGMDIREISRNGDCLDGEGAADCRLLGPPLNVDNGP